MTKLFTCLLVFGTLGSAVACAGDTGGDGGGGGNSGGSGGNDSPTTGGGDGADGGTQNGSGGSADGGTSGAGGTPGGGGGSTGGSGGSCVPGTNNGLSNGSGADYRCAITAGGGVTCFDAGSVWEVEDDGGAPVSGAVSVATTGIGSQDGCVAFEDGSLRCWTQGGAVSATPLIEADVKQVSGGYNHTCALVRPAASNGSVLCWGSNDEGQLGSGGGDSPTPVPAGLDAADDPIQISVGYRSSCALLAGGTIKCWGSNQNGEVGNGMTGSSVGTPTPTSALGGDAVSISVGQDQVCALLAGGDVQCWGANHDGRLGFDPPPYSLNAPDTLATTNQAVIAVSSAKFSTCFLLEDGSVDCQGDSGDHPSDTATLTDVVALSGGHHHHCAVHSNGSVTCHGVMSPSVSVAAPPCD